MHSHARFPMPPGSTCYRVIELSLWLTMVHRHDRKHPKRKRSQRDTPLIAPTDLYLNRELSLLAFNERVLAMAARTSVPLAERLRYVCIVSSNLDEFFEVRVSDLTEGVAAGSSPQVYATVLDRAHRLVAQQYELYNHTIMPALAKQDIVIINHAQRTADQRAWLRDYLSLIHI